MIVEIAVLVVLAALIGAVLLSSRRRRAQVMARRAGLLSPCHALFDAPMQRLSPLGYPRLGGAAQGAVWDVQVVPDALALRKLPALWLLVSLPEPLAVTGTLHLMLRPTGAEGFTKFATLPDQFPLPPGFPEDAGLRGDAPPDPQVLAAMRAALIFGDRLKEVIVSPRGLRLTLLLEEADRKNYLILRESDLGQRPVDAALLARAMAVLSDMRAGLTATERQAA